MDTLNSKTQAFTANGDETSSFENESYVTVEEAGCADKTGDGQLITECTILWWNGQYQRPNVDITKGKIGVNLGQNVEKIQMRHVPSGAIRYYVGGTYDIPNGTYVLSLFGSTYPYESISACINFDA